MRKITTAIKELSLLAKIGISALSILLSTWILLGTAYFNGYPLMMSDSSGYILRAFTRGVNHHWALFYSLFIRVTSFGDSIWWVIVVQNLIISYLIFRLLTVLFRDLWKTILMFFPLIFSLYYVSTLPLMSNLVMSDIFTTYGIFALILILLLPKVTIETCFLGFLLAMSIVAHNSHPIILGGTLIAVGAIVFGFKMIKKSIIAHANKKFILLFASFVFGSFILKPLVNSYFIFQPDGKTKVTGEEKQVSDSKYHFVWAKVRGNPLLYQRFLEKYCPEKDYNYLCDKAKMTELESDEDGLKDEFHGSDYKFFSDIEDAGRTMITDVEFVAAIFNNAFNRVWFMTTNVQLKNAYYDKYFEEIITEYVPNDLALVQSSLTYGGQLFTSAELKQMRNLNAISCGVGVLAMLMFYLLAIKFKELRNNKMLLSLFILVVAYLCNSILFGLAGNIFNARYSARVNWLLVFGGLLCVCYVLDILFQKYFKNTRPTTD